MKDYYDLGRRPNSKKYTNMDSNWAVDDHPDGSIQTPRTSVNPQVTKEPTNNKDWLDKNNWQYQYALNKRKEYLANQGNDGNDTYPYGNDLQDYFKERNEKAREGALLALQKQLDAQKGLYNTRIGDLGDQYQALRNQSEVERYKTRNMLKEMQANRGQLNSGFGRQENLIMDTKYGNAINSINLQEQKAKNDIRNLIAQLEAQNEAQKNAINNQYDNNLLQFMRI